MAALIAAASGWKRVLRTSGPQPFHTEVALRRSRGPPAHCPVGALTAPVLAAVSGLPATRSATAARSAGDSGCPWIRMLPSVSEARIASGPSVASASRGGALFSGVGCSWQIAQCCAYSVSPSRACASARSASSAMDKPTQVVVNARALRMNPPTTSAGEARPPEKGTFRFSRE